jgi:hypothetical protein
MKKFILSTRTKIIFAIFLFTLVLGIGILAYGYNRNEISQASSASSNLNITSTTYALNKRTKTKNCKVNGSLPDTKCTPGAVMTTDLYIICYTSTKDRRNVSSATSNQVYNEYNIIKPVNNTGKNQKYEVDHLIPLELGGSNDIANLFPEAASPTPGFREKDKVENYLHEQVCSGAISIQEAQYGIAINWLKYYKLLTTDILPTTTTDAPLISTTTTTVTIIITTSTSIISTTPQQIAPITPPLTSEPQVKKSTTGICHEKGTTYYNRTTNYTPYNSIQDCLNSGGRLPLK